MKYILMLLWMMFSSLAYSSPSITNTSVSDGIITLCWNTSVGKQYVGSFCTNLIQGRFEYYGTSVAGGTMSIPVLGNAGFIRLTEVDSALPVSFEDEYLESTVRGLIGYPLGYLWNFQVSGITSLNVNLSGVTNMHDVNMLSGLTNLSCSWNQISYLDLSGLTNLVQVDCSLNSITNMNLAGCSGLSSIFCLYNNIIDLQFIVSRATDGTLKTGTTLWLIGNPLGTNAINVQIPLLTGTYGFIIHR